MKISDPPGTTWSVSRRWLPWRRRWRADDTSLPASPVVGDSDNDVLAVLGLVLLAAVLVPVLLVALAVAIELLLLLALVPLAVIGRVLLGRDWRVEVKRRREPWLDEPAGDWRSSQERIFSLCAEIERGELPARTVPDR